MNKFVKICPQCGGIDIRIPKGGRGIMTAEDQCHDCGNIGNFPEVEIEKVKEFRKKLHK
ncbi:MAG: hypothetical protein V1837_02315 [Candidatus Woesearchaeota archaeon]